MALKVCASLHLQTCNAPRHGAPNIAFKNVTQGFPTPQPYGTFVSATPEVTTPEATTSANHTSHKHGIIACRCQPRFLSSLVLTMMTTIAKTKLESPAEHHVCTFLACPMPFTSQGGCALSTQGAFDTDDAAEGDNRITFENKAKFKDNLCDVSF